MLPAQFIARLSHLRLCRVGEAQLCQNYVLVAQACAGACSGFHPVSSLVAGRTRVEVTGKRARQEPIYPLRVVPERETLGHPRSPPSTGWYPPGICRVERHLYGTIVSGVVPLPNQQLLWQAGGIDIGLPLASRRRMLPWLGQITILTSRSVALFQARYSGTCSLARGARPSLFNRS